MINSQEIADKSREFGINPNNVEKDYVHGWILNGIQTQSTLGNQLVLKGGMTPRAISRQPIYFSWDARNVIVAAGRSRTLVELTYDGFRRLIEPYKIEYYVRKSDGIGSEYFWGYDHTGGKSGCIGMKQFFCNKIQFARATDMTFVPRYPIEL